MYKINNKGKWMIKTISSLAVLLGMVGCGGGTTSGSIGTGYYVDSAVSGADYGCGNQQGKTDSQGMFKFESGKECTFAINGKVFKSVAASKLIEGVVIQEDDEAIARFLMTLDNDGDAENGITISSSAAKKVSKVPQSDVDFALLNAALIDADGYHGSSITREDAKNHLSEAVDIVANANVSASEVVEGEMLTLSASESTISKGEISSYEWKEAGSIIGSQATFSKSDFSKGSHTITLVVKDAKGHEATDTVAFTIVEKTKWTGIPVLSNNGDSKLYVTSDANNLYFKLEAGIDTEDGIFYINSDDSTISGLTSMGIWPDAGFDYAIKSNGLYQLQNATDFDGVLIYDQNYTVVNNVLELTMAKSRFGYLAEDIGVGVLFPTLTKRIPAPASTVVNKFKDTHHDNTQTDTVPPILTISSTYLSVDGNYTKPTATAYDIFDGADVPASRVITDDSEVKPTVPGFYTVLHTATDIAGNEAKASTVVEVLGTSASKTLQRKNLSHLNQEVIINPAKNLVWASDNTPIPTGGSMSAGCLFIGGGTTEGVATTNFENFCANSNYAGLTGWRVPTPRELSEFIVQAKQEGIMPGMGKSNCVQTVAVDAGVMKSVWTRRKPSVNDMSKIGVQAGFIDEDFAFPAGGRCVRGSEDMTTRSLTSNNAKLSDAKTIEDADTNLMWVNEFRALNEGCLAIHSAVPAEYETSKDFCQKLGTEKQYAGFSDWRDPTSAELSEYVNKTNAAHIFVGFEAPCKKLLARDDINGTIVEKEVYTRYNGSKLGEIADLNLSTNIGLRCVRNK